METIPKNTAKDKSKTTLENRSVPTGCLLCDSSSCNKAEPLASYLRPATAVPELEAIRGVVVAVVQGPRAVMRGVVFTQGVVVMVVLREVFAVVHGSR